MLIFAASLRLIFQVFGGLIERLLHILRRFAVWRRLLRLFLLLSFVEALFRIGERLFLFVRQFAVLIELLFELIDEILILFNGLIEFRIRHIEFLREIAKHFGEFFEFLFIFWIGGIDEVAQNIGCFIVILVLEGIGEWLCFGILFHIGQFAEGVGQ